MEASLSFPVGAREDMRVSGSEFGEGFFEVGIKEQGKRGRLCTWDQNLSSWTWHRAGNRNIQVGDSTDYPTGRKACTWATSKAGAERDRDSSSMKNDEIFSQSAACQGLQELIIRFMGPPIPTWLEGRQ